MSPTHRYRTPATRMEATRQKTVDLVATKGQGAALEAVRWLVGPEVTMKSLADQAGISDSDLAVILTVHRGRIMHNKRRALEVVLDIPPGGLGVILAVVEDHIEQEENDGNG